MENKRVALTPEVKGTTATTSTNLAAGTESKESNQLCAMLDELFFISILRYWIPEEDVMISYRALSNGVILYTIDVVFWDDGRNL